VPQVVEAKIVVDRPRGPKGQPLKVAECIVGDESGVIVFTARNEQGAGWGRDQAASSTPTCFGRSGRNAGASCTRA
jgi:hypothetical protein